MGTPAIQIVTGFLGSGKTTLLRALLSQGAGGRRIGLVVNEIGAIGFDGAILSHAGASQMIELTAECICCAAGSDFLVAIEELIAVAEPDLILVETTGIAEPGGIIRQVRSADLALDAVVAVADGANLATALATAPVAAWQLRAADLIVLSKGDLLSPAEQSDCMAQIRQINQRARIIPAQHGQIAPELLFGPRLSSSDPVPAPKQHANLRSIIWTNNAPLARTAFTTVLDTLPSAIYRAKGLIYCTDAPWPDDVQFVAGRTRFTPQRRSTVPQPLNQLVLIGAGLEDQLAAQIQQQLDQCVDHRERIDQWYARQAD